MSSLCSLDDIMAIFYINLGVLFFFLSKDVIILGRKSGDSKLEMEFFYPSF